MNSTELERIKTTKGAYSFTLIMIESDGKIRASVGVGDSDLEMRMRLDNEDLRRIRQLIDDHLPQ